MAVKELKDFIVVDGDISHRGNGGVLARALSLTQVEEEH